MISYLVIIVKIQFCINQGILYAVIYYTKIGNMFEFVIKVWLKFIID